VKVSKYVNKGKDVEHDIHYAQGFRVLRYGSNDDPKPQFMEAFRQLNLQAAKLAGVDIASIKCISFSHPKPTETLLGIEINASATNGEIMKITLPKFGYREGTRELPEGKFENVLIPIHCTEEVVTIIRAFEAACEEYARDGNGQLHFEFVEKVVQEFAN
jgi:hypothetical protein